jgi:hypothetical protein
MCEATIQIVEIKTIARAYALITKLAKNTFEVVSDKRDCIIDRFLPTSWTTTSSSSHRISPYRRVPVSASINQYTVWTERRSFVKEFRNRTVETDKQRRGI